MAEGKINMQECADKTGKKPHYRGFITIDGVDHVYALWPASSGNGFSGKYKPKEEKPASGAKPEWV